MRRGRSWLWWYPTPAMTAVSTMAMPYEIRRRQLTFLLFVASAMVVLENLAQAQVDQSALVVVDGLVGLQRNAPVEADGSDGGVVTDPEPYPVTIIIHVGRVDLARQFEVTSAHVPGRGPYVAGVEKKRSREIPTPEEGQRVTNLRVGEQEEFTARRVVLGVVGSEPRFLVPANRVGAAEEIAVFDRHNVRSPVAVGIPSAHAPGKNRLPHHGVAGLVDLPDAVVALVARFQRVKVVFSTQDAACDLARHDAVLPDGRIQHE